jgi:hypothetical protein
MYWWNYIDGPTPPASIARRFCSEFRTQFVEGRQF